MTKRIQTESSKEIGGGMSREDRKNEAISRMIERQEQLRKKREEKKKLAVSISYSIFNVKVFIRRFVGS